MFVVLLCVVFSLFACDSNVSMELSNEAKKIVSTDEVKLVGEDGKATFRIVRPDSTDSSAGPVAVEIFKKYKELLNAIPKQVTDAEKSDGVREILVGDTKKDHGEYTADDPRGLWQDSHTYGFEWVDNKTIRFTVDGYVWRETELQGKELQKVYAQYMMIQISMATAFESRGLVTQDEWQWENTNKFIVVWVYLYQLDGHGLLKY